MGRHRRRPFNRDPQAFRIGISDAVDASRDYNNGSAVSLLNPKDNGVIFSQEQKISSHPIPEKTSAHIFSKEAGKGAILRVIIQTVTDLDKEGSTRAVHAAFDKGIPIREITDVIIEGNTKGIRRNIEG